MNSGVVIIRLEAQFAPQARGQLRQPTHHNYHWNEAFSPSPLTPCSASCTAPAPQAVYSQWGDLLYRKTLACHRQTRFRIAGTFNPSVGNQGSFLTWLVRSYNLRRFPAVVGSMIGFRPSSDQSNNILSVPFPLTKNLCFKMPCIFLCGFMHPSTQAI